MMLDRRRVNVRSLRASANGWGGKRGSNHQAVRSSGYGFRSDLAESEDLVAEVQATREAVGTSGLAPHSAIKVCVAEAYSRIVDGRSKRGRSRRLERPAAGIYFGARTLRLADGPDEVHKIRIAKNVLASYGWDFGN